MNKYSTFGFLGYLALLIAGTIGFIGSRPTALKATDSPQSSNSSSKADALRQRGLDRLKSEPPLQQPEAKRIQSDMNATRDYVWMVLTATYAHDKCNAILDYNILLHYSVKVGANGLKINDSIRAIVKAQLKEPYNISEIMPDVLTIMQDFYTRSSAMSCPMMMSVLKDEGIVQ